jgi:hypothetical protein
VATYREDMRRAWERINSFPTQGLETRFGTIEYADTGAQPGVPESQLHSQGQRDSDDRCRAQGRCN